MGLIDDSLLNSTCLSARLEVQLLRQERDRHHAVRELLRRDPPEPAHQPHLLVRAPRPLRPPKAIGWQLRQTRPCPEGMTLNRN